MAVSKDIRKYTENWLPLLDRFNDNPEEEYVVHCNTLREAHSVRLEFYKARTALQRSEESLKADPKLYREMGHPNLDRKEVRIVGTDVVFGFKDASRVAQLLRESVVYNRSGDTGSAGAEEA